MDANDGDQLSFQLSDGGGDGGVKIRSLTLCFNVVLGITGTAVLGIGAQMKTLGWILTPLFFVVGAAMSAELVWIVSATMERMEANGRMQVSGEEVSYQDFAQSSLGTGGWWASAVTTTFSFIGFINGGLVLEAQNLQIVLPLGSEEAGRKLWALILTSTTLMYCFVDMGTLLHKSGWSGILLTILSMIFVYGGTFSQAPNLQDFEASCFDSVDQPYHSLGMNPSETGFDGFMHFFSVTSYCVFVFAIIITLPTLRGKMRHPKKLTRMSSIAFAVVAAEFLVIMLGYYWIFGSLGPQNIVEGMRTDRPKGWWAMASPWMTGKPTWMGQALSICITFHLLCSDAIYVPCTVVSIEGLFPPRFAQKKRVWIMLRLLIALERLLVANYVKDFVKLTNLTSAAFVTTNNVLIPIIAFYRAGRPETTGWGRRAVHLLMFIFGIFNMVFGTVSAILDIVGDTNHTVDANHFPREGITEACKAAYHRAQAMGSVV